MSMINKEVNEFKVQAYLNEEFKEVSKYFDSIDKNILINILKRKIKDENLLWLIKEILYAQKREKGLEIRELYVTDISETFF